MKLLGKGILAALAMLPLPASATAGTLYVNGQIYTPSGWAEAMAVEDGGIVATGASATLRKRFRSNTQVVDLRGKTVLPGLADMHVHPSFAGQAALQCSFAQNSNGAQLLARVAQCVKAKKPGEWIIGGQYVADNLKDIGVSKEALDRVSPDNPVFLTANSYHDAWVNSKALAMAGITRATPDPAGGIIERDAKGEPTGILQEAARAPVQKLFAGDSAELNARALRLALNRLLSVGVTQVLDALVLRETAVAYDTLSDRGQLKQHVLGCPSYNQTLVPVPPGDFDDLIAKRATFARARFSLDCVKVFMDGTPTEGHTAALIEPYRVSKPGSPPRGLLLVKPDELNRKMVEWDRAGLLVKFHAAGDRSVRLAIDSIAAARKANGPDGPRHQVGHSNLVSALDLPRAVKLRATYEFSPYVWYPQPAMNDFAEGLGPERMQHAFPMRSAIATGALTIVGSDWPVVSDPDPWIAIETAVTRQPVGGGAQRLAPDEAISLKQILDMFTINAARAIGAEKQRGSLEAGKAADFVVLDQNPFKIPAFRLHTVRTLQTFVAGERVYQAPGVSAG